MFPAATAPLYKKTRAVCILRTRLLAVGESDSFDVRNVEGDWLKFLELTKSTHKRGYNILHGSG